MKPTLLLLFLTACLISCGKFEKSPVTLKLKKVDSLNDAFEVHFDKASAYRDTAMAVYNIEPMTVESLQLSCKYLDSAKYHYKIASDLNNKSLKLIKQ